MILFSIGCVFVGGLILILGIFSQRKKCGDLQKEYDVSDFTIIDITPKEP